MSWPLPSVTTLIISSALIFSAASCALVTFNFLPLAVLPMPSGPWQVAHLFKYKSLASPCAKAMAAPAKRNAVQIVICRMFSVIVELLLSKVSCSESSRPSDGDQVRAEVVSGHDLLDVIG